MSTCFVSDFAAAAAISRHLDQQEAAEAAEEAHLERQDTEVAYTDLDDAELDEEERALADDLWAREYAVEDAAEARAEQARDDWWDR